MLMNRPFTIAFGRGKHGTTTLFLSIILSAVILVECTYVSIVADLDRRYTILRALKQQTECYLAQYDRELFHTYGIYAFDSSKIDDEVFRKVLNVNGVDLGETLSVSGIYSFDTEDLRRAISVYYSYRTSGVIVDQFRDLIMDLLERADNSGLVEKIRSFTSSDAARILSDAINGASEVAETIGNLTDTLGIDGFSDKLSNFRSFLRNIRRLGNNGLDTGGGFDPSNFSFGINVIDGLYDYFGTQALLIDTVAFHSCTAHYASYNFDTAMQEDHAINGTSFQDLHDMNYTDSEYILTGLRGRAAFTAVTLLIFEVCFVKEFVRVYLDPDLTELIEGIAEILAIVVDVVSLGTVVLSPEVYRLMVTALFAEYYACYLASDVISGEKADFLKFDGITVLSLGYQDFVCLFMNYVPDSIILERINEILIRDYPDHAVEVELTTEFKGSPLQFSQYYELYAED